MEFFCEYEKIRLRLAGVKPNSKAIRIIISACRFVTGERKRRERLRPGHMASSSDYAAMPYLGHAPMRRDCSWPNPPILLSRFLMLPHSSSSAPQAASSLFTAVADGPQAGSLGVAAVSSPLKKFWRGARAFRLRFQEVA